MPKKMSNGYICISDDEQSCILDIYDNIQQIVKNASGANYGDCIKEYNLLVEQIKKLKNILQIKEII